MDDVIMFFSWFNQPIPASSPRHISFIISNGFNSHKIGEVDIYTGHITPTYATPFTLGHPQDSEQQLELAQVYAMALLAMAKCSNDHIKQARANGVIRNT